MGAAGPVLIVRKATNFERYGELAGCDREALQQFHNQHHQTLVKLRSELASQGLPVVEIGRAEDLPAGEFRACISFGGDGTLLAASHKLPAHIPLIGFRSSEESVGYLCSAHPGQEAQLVAALKNDAVATIKVARLQAYVTYQDGREPLLTTPVLNDILYANESPAETTRYTLQFGDRREVHRSSGIWIATAIGSSAAIRAAGGVDLPVTDGQAQFRVRELYREPGSRHELEGACFFPGQDELLIESACRAAILALDGQHGQISLAYGDRVQFRAGPPLILAEPKQAR